MLKPIFGEETGEFIDFTSWSPNCVRLASLSITDVKPPKLG